MSSTPPAVIEADYVAFMQGGVSICASACNRERQPSVARANGCRVSPERSQVTILLSASQSAELLEHVRETGAIAVVFSEPPTHRTVQLKGSDAVVEAANALDGETAGIYRARFAGVLAQLGYQRDLIYALLACADDDLVAVRFTPSAAFSQTPGPNAGQALLVHA
jgi:hypothetical protein